MIIQRSGLAAAVLVLSSSYSYSEVITGTTNNAAAGGLTWNMNNVLPPEAGLTVGGVIYRYTIDKDPAANTQVHIQNENAIDGGLLFRNTDDWSGLPGNTIVKSFTLPTIPLQYFGDGSIQVEGEGDIRDPFITYNYRYDTCFNPLSDPSCPGYEDNMYQYLLDNGLLNTEVEGYDPLADEFVRASLEREVDLESDEEQEKNKEEEEDESSLEDALSIADNAIAIAEGAATLDQLSSLANLAQFNSYLTTNIPGGVYNDSVALEDAELPDNINALRVSFAQQRLHQEMVDSQYTLGN
jgi:hypothetical protein